MKQKAMKEWGEKVLEMHSMLIKKVVPRVGSLDGDDEYPMRDD